MLRSAILRVEVPTENLLNVRARLARALIQIRNQVRNWGEIRRQRRALLSLSDAMLKDMGISRVDALQEGTKPFWRS